MIEAVSKIGDYVQGLNDGGDSLSRITENPDSNGKYKHVLVVALNEKEGNYSFSHVELQGFKDYKIYLYKGKKGNSTDATPTCRITEMEKTFKNKFLRWFENYEEYPLSGEEKESVKKMGMAIKAEQEKILTELQDKFSGRKPGESGIITLGIDDEDIKYLIDIPLFRNVLLKKGSKAFSNKYDVESTGKNAMCSICREVKTEVYGFAIPWTFHTFNKRGFVAGGFNVADAWKNTPVCYDCATHLEIGKKYAEENLDFEFSTGIRYMLIPKLALGGDFQEILSILGAKVQKRKQKLNHEVGSHITADEEEILDIVKEQSDFISNSLLFYKKNNSEYQIVLHVDGILPSRLGIIFRTKEKVDERFKIYHDLALNEDQKEKNRLEFNFKIVRWFFPSGFDKTFMEVVNKIFVGNDIDYRLMIGYIMDKVSDEFNRDDRTNVTTLNGFLFLHYLKELSRHKNANLEMNNMDEPAGGDLLIEEIVGAPLEQRIKGFFEANKDFFDCDAKKAVFLEGVLAQNLLNIQGKNKNATPFRHKLHGLKMNKKLIERLLPEIQNKLEEYRENYYRNLETIIASHFVLAKADWKITDDEISFYFVLGMNLQKLFKKPKEEEENTGEVA